MKKLLINIYLVLLFVVIACGQPDSQTIVECPLPPIGEIEEPTVPEVPEDELFIVCHKPNNMHHKKTLYLTEEKAEKHLKHGDVFGECEESK